MLKVIIAKELKRVFSDRKLVFNTFILPALAIAIIYSMMGTLITKMNDDVDTHIASIAVHNTPASFMEYLDTTGAQWAEEAVFSYSTSDDELLDVKQSIKEGSTDVLVVFDKDFDEKINNYKSDHLPQVNTYFTSTEDYSQNVRSHVIDTLLNDYQGHIIGNRLGNINYATAFEVDKDNPESNLGDTQKNAGKMLSRIIPMLLTILLFAGAMGVGMDAIAGEKERGTFATMFVAPIKRETIALGKIISLSIISMISAASSMIGILISLPFSGSMFTAGTSDINITELNFGLTQFIQLIAILIPMVLLFVVIVCLLSMLGKNVKEAGTYVAPVYMVVMGLALTSNFITGDTESWQFAIPIYGSCTALKSLFNFELSWGATLIHLASTLVIAYLINLITTKLFYNEKIMFSA